jgi:hypothetical protein
MVNVGLYVYNGSVSLIIDTLWISDLNYSFTWDLYYSNAAVINWKQFAFHELL